MTTTEQRIAHLSNQIANVRRLMWNASQMRRGSVCQLGDELDRLCDERDRLMRRGA